MTLSSESFLESVVVKLSANKTRMEVQFKVYTFWKENEKPEVRRFGIGRDVVSSFQYLNAKLQDIYPKLRGKHFTVSWKDEEGDDVTISSDDEIMIALTSMSDDLKKLYVHCKESEERNDDCDIVITAVSDNPGTSGNVQHSGVVCDGCEMPVTGFRYKCTSCDDYDLCSKCEAVGLHPEHCMVRVPAPTLPRTVIKAAVKRSRHFLKTLSAINEEQCKRQRHEGERRRDHGHGHGHRRQSREDHSRRSRTSWLETFATYMNEFANLAGDVGLEPGDGQTAPKESTPNQTETPKPTPTNQETPKPTATGSSEPNQQQKPKTQLPQCPFTADNLTIDNVQKLLNMLGGNLHAFVPQPSTSKPEPDVEMGQGDRKSSETDKDSVKSDVSSTTNASQIKKEESPDKADGWTVINKDLMDSEAKANEPDPPIGFNLPEEFRERVRISGQSLYPPLNIATAVLNPQADIQDAPQPSAPEDTAIPEAKDNTAKASTKPDTSVRHPTHIQAAIEQMTAMGFTNEGGWLTQLLESKDGNISAVLDLLTPTNPKK
ncbi:unnamed protein product [Leptosia nina]|uniref:Sequestosome-1 n=1 Tax=Leptosia nina TaxID=320188 RepID=A0AAV1J996_9NEOP